MFEVGQRVSICWNNVRNIDGEIDAQTLQTLIQEIEHVIAAFSDPARRGPERARLASAAKERVKRAQPGSDVQLLWANTFIGAARKADDLAWVRGLLDGTTKLTGLAVDFDLRWGVINALATTGAAGKELIAAELYRDASDHGLRAAASARAAQPLKAAKSTAWEAVMDDGTRSLQMKRAIAGGFHRVDQEELLSPFVTPYFDRLMPIWESHDSEEAISIVGWMYPRAVLTQEVVEATDTALAQDLPAPFRRLLLESQDGVKRALRAQAFDRA